MVLGRDRVGWRHGEYMRLFGCRLSLPIMNEGVGAIGLEYAVFHARDVNIKWSHLYSEGFYGPNSA